MIHLRESMGRLMGCLLLCDTLLTACEDGRDEDLLSHTGGDKEENKMEVTTRVSTYGLGDTGEEEEDFPLDSKFRMDVDLPGGWQTTLFQRTTGGWQQTGGAEWDFTQDSTSVVALYPACETYTSASLYDASGALTDLLYACGRVATGERLTLTFRHLFARLQVKLDASLLSSVTAIELSVPALVTEVKLPSAALSFSTDTRQTVTTSQSVDDRTTYSFLVPSGQRLALQLRITTASGHSETRSIASTLFEAGRSYSCSLSASESAVGIHSAEEFLEWMQLYNDSRAKAVERFGIERDGRTVFLILNDLDFSTTDLTDFRPIGATDSESFGDVLDGMGHTLSRLTFPENRCGLVFHLSNEGEICDLTLDQCSATVTTAHSYGYGLLVNKAEGLLRNCHVNRCTLTVDSSANDIGVWAGVLSGDAINCTTYLCRLQGGLYAGAVGQLHKGRIVNCAIQSLCLDGPLYCGSFLGRCNPNASGASYAYILNSAVHDTAFAATSGMTSYGYLGGTAKYLSIQYSYYPTTSLPSFGSTENCKATKLRYYDASTFTVTTDGVATALIDLLNQWTANRNYVYSSYSLAAWSLATDEGVFTLQ